MLVGSDEGEEILDALSAGATGCLLKDSLPAEILGALRDIHQGGSPMSSHVARKVVSWFQQSRPRLTMREPLTDREMQVLKLLATGSQDQQIAKALAISIFTVRSHVRSIFDKLDVHSRTEAVVKFLGRTAAPEK
jgi:DNA-binding NarL/FixJ family response regulator